MSRQSQYLPLRNEWQKRVDASFVKYWSASKAMRLCKEIKNEQKQQEAFRRAFLEMAAASRLLAEAQRKVENPVAPRVWKAINASLDGEGKFEGGKPGFAYAQNPESSGLFRTLVLLKHGVTFRSLIADIEKTGADMKSCFRYTETITD